MPSCYTARQTPLGERLHYLVACQILIIPEFEFIAISMYYIVRYKLFLSKYIKPKKMERFKVHGTSVIQRFSVHYSYTQMISEPYFLISCCSSCRTRVSMYSTSCCSVIFSSSLCFSSCCSIVA